MPSVLEELRKALAARRRGAAAAQRYAEHKARVGARQAAQAAAGQELGPMPEIADPARRAEAAASFKRFCEIYFPHVFCMAWCPDHLKVIAGIEAAVASGGLYAIGMPRGSGKTALLRTAVLWAALTGRHLYIVWISATGSKAKQELAKIKRACETNETLVADWPEVLWPIVRLERVTQRQRAQKYQGVHTRIEWLDHYVVMPTIEGSAASGAMIFTTGLEGSDVRGPSHQTADGRLLRPSLVIIDDPQTRESAKSPTQTQFRLDLLMGDILGQAGPGESLAAFATVTKIYADDLADRLLDRQRYPDWQGECYPMVYAWPSAEAEWAEYARLRLADLRDGARHLPRATAYYAAHRALMDAGAEVAWPERREAWELSALQHAWDLRLRDPAGFASEYQNQPLPPAEEGEPMQSADALAARTSGHPRGAVPSRASMLTGFIDVHAKLLFWMVCGWSEDFSGWIVDYGTYPEQGRALFTARDAPITFRRRHQNVEPKEALRLAVEACARALAEREWRREDGTLLRLDRLLVDRGWETPVIDTACRRLGGVVMPAQGHGVGPDDKPMSEYERRPGERRGHEWWVPSTKGKSDVRHVRPNTNYWKSFVHQRLALGLVEPGSIVLFGKEPHEHRLLAEHLVAEHPLRKTGRRGRTVDVWEIRVKGRDNHWLDCLVGCAAAASYQGLIPQGAEGSVKPKHRTGERRRRRWTQSDLRG